jgi:putative hemolysin
VVPVHFAGTSGRLFQFARLVAPRLSRLMLPRELRRQRDSRVQMQIGAPISAARLARFRDSEAAALHLRLKTFLAPAQDGSAPRPADTALPVPTPTPVATAMPRDALVGEIAALASNLVLRQGDLCVYCAEPARIPRVLSEIGRLRELTGRACGAGTGHARDLERFDKTHDHLIVWHAARLELVGACRIGRTDIIRRQHGANGLHTSTAFRFRKFFFTLLGPAFELSQLFVRAECRDNGVPLQLLWKGIGELAAREPRYCRLIGCVRLGADYSQASQQLLIGYLRTHGQDHLLSTIVAARDAVPRTASLGTLVTELAMLSKVDALGALIEDIEADGKNVPAALRQYLKLGGRALGFNVPATAENAIDCLLTVDLRHSKPRALRRFMGEDAAARFECQHRRRAAPYVG